MIRILKTFAILSLIGVSTALAQRAYWTPSGGTLQQGKSNQLQLIFEDCTPQSGLAIPAPQGITLTEAGTSNSTSIINGSMTRKLIVNFRAVPTAKGQVSIPSFIAKTDKGDVQVNDAVYEVVEATIGNTGVKPEDVFFNQFQVEDETIYVGEIFKLRYLIGFKQGYQVNSVSEPALESKTLVTTGLSSFDQQGVRYKGEPYIGLIYDTQAMATQAGTIEIPSTSQTVSIVVGRNRNFIFDEPIVDNFNVSTQPFPLEIKPLPSGAPQTFHGAVGEFRLDSKVVPESVQVGEPVTWTLELSGTGNWPSGIGLPPRNVSTDFRAIQPDLKTEFDENDIFTGSQSEDIVLIPTKEGAFTFGPLEYTYFNPASEQYETVRIPPRTVTVTGIAPSGLGTLPGDESSTQDSQARPTSDRLSVELDPAGVNMLTKPIELPTEAIQAGDHQGLVPDGPIQLKRLWWTPLPALGLWILLAISRAAYLNPTKKRRAALATLKRICKQATSKDQKALQIEWRTATRDFWGLTCEEPSAREIEQAVASTASSEQATTWRRLWERSDSTLFALQDQADASWFSDLSVALRQAPKPRFSLVRLFSSRAWKAVSLGLILATPFFQPQDLQAEANAYDSYQKGDFATAQKLWTGEFSARSNDWSIRHNAGLAAAQQEDWGHALAYWTAAFVLKPQDESIRWNLKLALNRSGAYDPTLAKLVDGKRFNKIVTRLSPGEWKRTADYAIYLVALLLAIWVLTRYLRFARSLGTPLLLIVCVAIGTTILADWAFTSYGMLVKPEAVIVAKASDMKSLPTDVNVEQLSSPLSEGAIALQRKTFLGWSQIELPNDEIGWVRSSTLVPVYTR